MAKKKISPAESENDEVPEGKVDDEGDEVIDLFEEEDNLEEDLEYDLSHIEDEMLVDETEEEGIGQDIDEVEMMLRKVKCDPCPGSSSKRDCIVRDDFGCPPDKAKK